MSTVIYTKKGLMEMLDRELKDDDPIIFSNDIDGTLSFSKKKGTKVPFSFAPDAFVDEGVGHIFKGESIPLSIIITSKKHLSGHTRKLFVNQQVNGQ